MISIRNIQIFSAALACTAAAGPAGETKAGSSPAPVSPSGSFFGLPHYRQFGLLLGDEHSVRITSRGFMQKEDSLLPGLNSQVEVVPGHSAVFLRIRKDFQYYNEDVPGASLLYSKQSGSEETYDLHGALMLDLFVDGISNQAEADPGKKGFRPFFRLGAELDRSNLDADATENVQKYFALLALTANPDRDNWTSPQFIQAGAVLERDVLADTENWKIVLNWTPRFLDTNGFTLGNRQYYEELFDVLSPGEKITGEQDTFTFIHPNLGIESSVSADEGAPGADDDFCLCYGLHAGIGLAKGRVVLSADLKVTHPSEDLGDPGTLFEARADFHSFLGTDGLVAENELSAFVSWTKGEETRGAPDVDRINAGISLRF